MMAAPAGDRSYEFVGSKRRSGAST